MSEQMEMGGLVRFMWRHCERECSNHTHSRLLRFVAEPEDGLRCRDTGELELADRH